MALIGLLACCGSVRAEVTEYRLVVERKPINITGKTVDKITINGTIPGPTLQFTEGDDAVIHVTNKMHDDTSIHWHGFLIPDGMDGVPGFGGFPGIKPGETFTYRFRIRQSGTYWYHAHSGGQEQDGHYGAVVIHPRSQDPVQTNPDYVVLLSDYTDEESDAIMAHLKMDSEYYQYNRLTVGDFFKAVREKGLRKTWENVSMWGRMRMLPTDLSDVSGYTFLVNGRTPEQNWTGLFRSGERVRLRFINASAMTFYDVRIHGLAMTVVSSDGQNIEPLTVDEFRIGIAETYDVIVSPQEEKAYTIVAEPIDRTGFALATLAPREGMRGNPPVQRPRALLTLVDMGMGHDGHGASGGDPVKAGHNHEGMDHASHGTDPTDHPSHRQTASGGDAADYDTGVPGSGWAETGAPAGARLLAYKNLRYLARQKDIRPPEREIELHLGGNMNRYVWTINGRKFSAAEPIRLRYGERLRIRLINETMMAHTMHLHGMFVQIETGQAAEKLPSKHTVIIAPGDSSAVLLTADEPGEWAFHCHMIYHMLAGMMTKVIVAEPEKDHMPADTQRDHKTHATDSTNHGHAGHGAHAHSPAAAPMNHGRKGAYTPADKLDKRVRTEHGERFFHAFRLAAGVGSSDGDGMIDWHFDGWIGTDENKLWLKSQGERKKGETEQAELWALYSRNIGTFWDAQIGIRYDSSPTSLSYIALGMKGLAPYFFEVEAYLFLSSDGDMSANLHLENDLLITQRLVLQPYLEASLYARDAPDRSIGAGLSSASVGLQLRYELTRKFAPYIDARYLRKFGKTARIARHQGEDCDAFYATVGLRLMF